MASGTGVSGELTYSLEQPAFNALGLQVCDVNVPHWETADLQTSVQYLVYAIRQDFKQSHRPIAVFGIGQGGLLARMALAYWPSLRQEVGDVVAVAAPEYGSTVPPHTGGSRCSETHPCVPAIWQQIRKAHLITWIGKHHAQAPGADLVDDGPLGQRRGGPAHRRAATDVGAQGRQQHPDPGRVPGPHHQSRGHGL